MKNVLSNKKIVVTLFILSFLMLSGCATVEGVGKDLERAGEAVQEAAENE